MAKQIKIEITCDEGFVADSLREIANAVENDEKEYNLQEYNMHFETFHYDCEICG